MKFPEFNNLVNPTDDKCYVALSSTGVPRTMTFKDVTELSKNDPSLEIGWIIPKGYFVIETECHTLLSLIASRNEKVMVVSNGTTLQIYCKGNFDKTTENNLLACGASAKTYAYNKRKAMSVILPFKNKKVNASSLLNSLTIAHSNGIEETPTWLEPLRKISVPNADGLDLPIQGNTHTLLTELSKKIKTTSPTIVREVITLVNEELCTQPLTTHELETFFTSSESTWVKQFFEGNNFMHNKLGDYIIERCNIKKDSVSKQLYFYNESLNIYSNDEDFITGYITKLCPTLKDYQITETVKYIQRYLYDETVVFNENPFTVVFKNGILDLSTMQLEPMTPDYLESIKINCNYDPKAYSDTVDEFFNTATNGNKQTEQLLYEAIGYSMLKTNELQKAFLLVGSGRNGKSTYLDLIRNVLGKKNTTTVSLRDLTNNFRAAMLDGKLASLAGDISSQTIQESDLIKSISAGEEITVEEKYKQAHSKSLFSTLFYACNKIPRTSDTSDGFYRRWCIIPFNANLSGVTRVDGMLFKKKLLEQQSLDYVAYKAIHAIHQVLTTTNEFTEPQEVLDMMTQYRIDNSTVLSWFRDIHKNNKQALQKLKVGAAYVSYSKWCEETGRSKSSQTTFVNSIKADLGIDLAQ